MMASDDRRKLEPGDRLRSLRDGWSGSVENVIRDDDDDPQAIVILLDEPLAGRRWMTLDLADVQIIPASPPH